MDATGTVRKYSKSDNLEDEFNAVVVNLGSLGIILSIKIQCEKAFNLEQIEYPAKLEHVRIFQIRKIKSSTNMNIVEKMLQSLDVHMKSSDHFRMFWYPHSDDVMVYNVSRTTKVTNLTKNIKNKIIYRI
jgi:L-gulonolactone oxidase